MFATDFITSMKLDDDMEEEIGEEIENAKSAWSKWSHLAMGDQTAFYTAILEDLGTSFDDSIAGELLALEKGSLCSFTDWYIRWLFKVEDEGEYPGGEDTDNVIDQTKESGWSQVKWTVQPVAKPIEGVSWQCNRCRIINVWKESKCIGCDDDAPHAADLPKETLHNTTSNDTPSSSVFSFPNSSSVGGETPAGAISSAGFSFPVSSITATGFSFTPAASSSVPSSAGFSFHPSNSTSAFKFPAEKEL